MNKKYIEKFINEKYFDYPKSAIKSFWISKKFNYFHSPIELLNPMLIICNKTTEFDEFLLRSTISTDYVVLKEYYVRQLYANTLSDTDKKEILRNIKKLESALISVVVFPEIQMTIFGKSQTIPTRVTEFLFETKLNLKFINFVNSYFAKPIWASKFRKIQTVFNSKFNISNNFLSTLSSQERNAKINGCMPSSASIYGQKNKISIRSNKLASGLESVVFACPNCREFFTLSPELNHLKCHSCLIPFECTHSGDIYSNGKTITFDNIEDFLSDVIKEKKFDKNFVARYENATLNIFIHGFEAYHIKGLSLEIFTNKIKFTGIDFEKVINLKDFTSFELLPSNTLKFNLKSTEEFSITANGHDNLYILYLLIKEKTQH